MARSALAIWVRYHGPENHLVNLGRHGLADVLLMRGKTDEARELLILMRDELVDEAHPEYVAIRDWAVEKLESLEASPEAEEEEPAETKDP